MLKYFDIILQKELQPEAWDWLTGIVSKIKSPENKTAFFTAFTAVPRHTGKAHILLAKGDRDAISQLSYSRQLETYTIDRLARLWLIMHFPSQDKSTYLSTISQLFKAAEMNELVALYSALPFLEYPGEWVTQCTEGIRSNMGVVLEAIMCDNPYPSEYLDQPAWNQLVLKAFFTEKPVNRIIGLDERANKELAHILSDYAHERWAAGRTFDPQLWRVMVNFVDDHILKDLEKVFGEGSKIEKIAAALVCYQSGYLPAKLLLNQYPELKSSIQKNQINWDYIAQSLQTTHI